MPQTKKKKKTCNFAQMIDCGLCAKQPSEETGFGWPGVVEYQDNGLS